MAEDKYTQVLTLTSGIKIFITKELKKQLKDDEIKPKEFWKLPIEVVKVDKDGIVFGKINLDKGICPIRVGLCAIKVMCDIDVRGYLLKEHSFEHPLVFLSLEQLVFELKKLDDKNKQREYAMMIKELLSELFIKESE